MIDLPLNDEAARVVRGWHGIRRGEYVFYNPETGGQWKDLWLGLKKACRKAGLDDVTWHTFRHSFASRLTRAGADLGNGERAVGAFDHQRDDAIRSYEPRCKNSRGSASDES